MARKGIDKAQCLPTEVITLIIVGHNDVSPFLNINIEGGMVKYIPKSFLALGCQSNRGGTTAQQSIVPST